MPKVPEAQLGISTNVPSVNAPYSRDFGQLGKDVSAAGSDLAQASLATLEMQKKAEAIDASSQAYTEDKLWANNQITQLKLQSPDGYIHEDPNDQSSPVAKNPDGSVRTITREFYDKANERFQDNQQKMPSMLASQMYKERALPHLSDETGKLQNDAQTMKVTAYDQHEILSVKALAADITNTPVIKPAVDSEGKPIMDPKTGQPMIQMDASKLYGNLQDTQLNGKQNIGIMHNSTQNDLKQVQYGHIYTDEAFRNFYNSALLQKKEGDPTRIQGIDAMLALAQGTDPQSMARKAKGLPTFSDTMDGKQRDIEIDKLNKLRSNSKLTDAADFKFSAERGISALQAGNADPGTADRILLHAHELAKSGVISPEAATDLASRAIGAQGVADTQGVAFKSLSYSDQVSHLKMIADQSKIKLLAFAQANGLKDTSNLGAIVDQNLTNASSRVLLDNANEKSHDFPAFSQSISGNKLAAVNWGSPTGTAVGDTPQRIQEQIHTDETNWNTIGTNRPEDRRTPAFSLAASQKTSEWLTGRDGTPTPLAAKGFQNFSTAYGNYTGDAVNQMYKDGKISAAHAALLPLFSSGSKVDTESLNFTLDALNKKDVANADFKQKEAIGGPKEDAVRAAVGNAFKDWASAQTNPEFRAKVLEAAETGTKLSMTSNDPNEAAQYAYQQMIGKHVNVSQYSSGWNGASGTYITPNQVGGKLIGKPEQAVIDENLKNKMSDLSKEDIYLPPGSSIAGLAKRALPVYTPSPQPGYNLVYREGDGPGRQLVVTTASSKGKQNYFIPLEKLRFPVGGASASWAPQSETNQ